MAGGRTRLEARTTNRRRRARRRRSEGFAREEGDVVAEGANGRYNLNPWLTFIDPKSLIHIGLNLTNYP